MTATAAITSASAASSALSGRKGVDLRDPARDAGSFDRQLEAARQQRTPDRNGQHSADSHEVTARANDNVRPSHDRPQKNSGKPTGPGTDAQAPAKATSTPSVAPQTATSPTPDSTAGDATATTTATAEDQTAGSLAAASLAGAMLALLPSAAAALQAGGAATGSAGSATKPNTAAMGAIDTGAATPLPPGDAANAALTAAADALVAGHDGLSKAVSVVPLADAGKTPGSDTGQATALLAAPANAVSAAPQLLQLQVPAGSPAFGHELGQQVAWLTGQGVKQASIRLHPEELGQLDVKISMSQGRVDVVFNAQHPAAVTAVQQTLPQLDHLLAQHGLSLGHAEVSQQQQRGDRQETRSQPRSSLAAGEVDEIHSVEHLQASSGTVSLLDAFA